jgi:uncharacterized membrane protein
MWGQVLGVVVLVPAAGVLVGFTSTAADTA